MSKLVTLVLRQESKERFRNLSMDYPEVKNISVGFSWSGFCFAQIMLLVRGLWGTLIISCIIWDVVTTFGGFIFIDIGKLSFENYFIIILILLLILINAMIFGIYFNKWYAKKLLTIGYTPATKEDKRNLLIEGILIK